MIISGKRKVAFQFVCLYLAYRYFPKSYLIFCASNLLTEPLSSLEELSFDENNHIAKHYLLHGHNEKCNKMIADAWSRGDFALREVRPVVGQLAELYFGENPATNCPAVCVDRGTKKSLAEFVIPEKYFGIQPTSRQSVKILQDWINEHCQRIEFGFINWTPTTLQLYWIDADEKRVDAGRLGRKEQNAVWQVTSLGHKFDVVDPRTGALVVSLVAEYPAMNVIGDAGSKVVDGWNVTMEVQHTLSQEWDRAHRVKRTFTKLGFKKGRMPQDLWSSIWTYYYNNRFHTVREEWESKGFYVNWWEKDVYMIGIPWELKTYWQSRIMKLVEAWVGVDLELTDIYGMRRYEDGARLLTHVDREETHATSMIINIAQGSIREPWPLQIYDFADRLHEITMDEGDIIYYESARCLHGRMKPLKGGFYVNMFAHYRPIGDPQWFLQPNPSGTPEQLLASVQPCVKKDGNSTFCSAGHELPFVSPSLDQLHGPGSLFKHWLDITQKESRIQEQLISGGVREEL